MTITTTCGAALDMLMMLRLLTGIKMPPAAAFALNKAIVVLSRNPDVTAAMIVREDAIKRHGQDKGDGTSFIPPEALQQYLTEWAETAFRPAVLELPTLPIVIQERFLASDREVEPAILSSLSELWEVG